MKELATILALFMIVSLSVSENKKAADIQREENLSKLIGFKEYKSRVDAIRRSYE